MNFSCCLLSPAEFILLAPLIYILSSLGPMHYNFIATLAFHLLVLSCFGKPLDVCFCCSLTQLSLTLSYMSHLALNIGILSLVIPLHRPSMHALHQNL